MSPTEDALRGLSVLVVDDHADSRERWVELLRAAGAIVIGVRTPNAALGYATTARFDAVVVDLPTDGGSRLLRGLRGSRAPSADAPVFAISGERHDQPYREMFSGYFLKPVDRDALVTRLADAARRPPP